jgi:hypothetical protein
MACRQDHTANDGCDLLAQFTEQIVTKKGDRDQRNQPETSKDENKAVFVAAATYEP